MCTVYVFIYSICKLNSKKNMKSFANICSTVPTRWLHLPSFACLGQAANRIVCIIRTKTIWTLNYYGSVQDDDLVGKHLNFQSVCPVLSTGQSDVCSAIVYNFVLQDGETNPVPRCPRLSGGLGCHEALWLPIRFIKFGRKC